MSNYQATMNVRNMDERSVLDVLMKDLSAGKSDFVTMVGKAVGDVNKNKREKG